MLAVACRPTAVLMISRRWRSRSCRGGGRRRTAEQSPASCCARSSVPDPGHSDSRPAASAGSPAPSSMALASAGRPSRALPGAPTPQVLQQPTAQLQGVLLGQPVAGTSKDLEPQAERRGRPVPGQRRRQRARLGQGPDGGVDPVGAPARPGPAAGVAPTAGARPTAARAAEGGGASGCRPTATPGYRRPAPWQRGPRMRGWRRRSGWPPGRGGGRPAARPPPRPSRARPGRRFRRRADRRWQPHRRAARASGRPGWWWAGPQGSSRAGRAPKQRRSSTGSHSPWSGNRTSTGLDGVPSLLLRSSRPGRRNGATGMRCSSHPLLGPVGYSARGPAACSRLLPGYEHPTRNQKVVGSNPTSGSISAAQGYQARRADLDEIGGGNLSALN